MSHLCLVGNYRPDGQQSMQRFSSMFMRGLEQNNARTSIWSPPVVFGGFAQSTLNGYGKWLGYLDKWILAFPLLLIKRLMNPHCHFHICDHSNAPYLMVLPHARSSITCHDVLAIRGALGDADAKCEASGLGRLLQKWILRNLVAADVIATDSDQTLRDLIAVTPHRVAKARWQTIHVALNESFVPSSDADVRQELLDYAMLLEKPFLLHVGSGLPRKNRVLLLKLLYRLTGQWDGLVCFAGDPLDASMRASVQQFGLESRVVEVPRPSHERLQALYTRCFAMIFPSYSEGFGWPPLEAQACGAPVVSSSVEPMPEIGGPNGLYADPDDVEAFATQVLRLTDEDYRQQVIALGEENVKRFDLHLMIQKYLKLMDLKIA